MNGTKELKAFFICDGKACKHCNPECRKTSNPEHWKNIPAEIVLKDGAAPETERVLKFTKYLHNEIKSEFDWIMKHNEYDFDSQCYLYWLYRNLFDLTRMACGTHKYTDIAVNEVLRRAVAHRRGMCISENDDLTHFSLIQVGLLLFMIHEIGGGR